MPTMGTKACNDADSRPTLRTGVRGIYLAAPLHGRDRNTARATLGRSLAVSAFPRYVPV